MRISTATAAAVLLGIASFFACDVSTLGPGEPERTLSPSGNPAGSATSLATSSGAVRTAGRGLDLDEEGCARSPGYWCHKKDGQLETYGPAALVLLANEGVLLDETALSVAVCDTRHQLLRHLASLALNLAAGFVDASDPLTGDDAALGTVGDAFSMGAAVYLLGDAAPRDERNAAKDVLDRINNNENVDNACTSEPGEPGEEEDGEGQGPSTNANPNAGSGGGPPPPSATACPLDAKGKMPICHLPPGNPLKPQMISIAPSAWTAHEAHGDTCPPCS